MDENTPWYDGLNIDAETAEVIQAKAWGDVNTIVKSYRDLEKHLGADKNDFIKIPKGEGADYSEVWKALGRPETAEGYELGDTDMAKAARDAMFEAGLSKEQASKLNKWFEGYNASSSERADALVREGIDRLKKEWGGDFEKNVNTARAVVKQYGYADDVIDKIGDAVGADIATKLFYDLAGKSDTTRSVNGYMSGGETKTMAIEKIKQMQSDPEVMKKLAEGDEKTAAELNRLAALTVTGA